MKKVIGLVVTLGLIVGFTAISEANDRVPIALTDAQMSEVVAGAHESPGKAHQSYASVLKGGVACLVPDHVRRNYTCDTECKGPGKAHQSYASVLKGDVRNIVPDHVRKK